MAALSPRNRTILVAALAVALVCAPLYVAPYDGERATEYRYDATRLPADEALASPGVAAVADCDGESLPRACLLERRVRAAGGTLRTSADGYVSARGARYEFVRLDGDYYRTDERLTGDGTLVLRQGRTDRAEVVQEALPAAAERPAVVARAVETGNATVAGSEPPVRDTLVRHDGGTYRVELVDVDSRDPSRPLTALKLGAVPVGLWLLVYRVRGLATDASRAERALAALGVVVVLAGLVVPPGATPTYRYTASAVSADEVPRYLPNTLDCGDLTVERECALEGRVRANGTVAASVDARYVDADYRYVRFPDGYARPNASVRHGRARLSLNPVPRERVYADAFRDLLAAERPVQRAILADDGVVSAADVHWEGEPTVRLNDRYYRVSRERAHTLGSDEGVRWGLKVGLVALGLALVVGSRRLVVA